STLDVPDAVTGGKSVKDKALFTRIVEIDRSSGEATPTTKTFAYPLSPADWQDGKSGKAKLGDLVAVDNTHFLIMEQGAFKDNLIHNKIFLVDISAASDISGVMNGALELETITTTAGLINAGVKTAQKTLIGDMRDYGWLLEKAEGLALVDDKTIALINDDDFGMGVDAHDADGNAADATKLYVDTTNGKVSDGSTDKVYSYQATGNDPSQRRTQLWLIKLAKPVLQFQQNYSYAQAGDLVFAKLSDFHPTQPAIGYDQIYYKLGRYKLQLQAADGAINKIFGDYCEDMGAKEASAVGANPTINDPSTFTCAKPLFNDANTMKSAVVGPNGQLYLTDGHHSFTSYWEAGSLGKMFGGGPDVKVWVKITANFSNSKAMDEFWQKMKSSNNVWLKDGSTANNDSITVAQLPTQLGLSRFHNDRYRSLIYFTRDIGYVQPPSGTEFLEFYWEDWMRSLQVPLMVPTDSTSFADYLTAVSNTANAMVTATNAGGELASGKTGASLGGLTGFVTKEYNKLSVAMPAVGDTTTKPGKLAYALDYKASLAP
ncbi:MAG: ParB-like protein, partial [Pedobacter sp.]|nr:ParB-like protein [Pedobacter sp.]